MLQGESRNLQQHFPPVSPLSLTAESSATLPHASELFHGSIDSSDMFLIYYIFLWGRRAGRGGGRAFSVSDKFQNLEEASITFFGGEEGKDKERTWPHSSCFVCSFKWQ